MNDARQKQRYEVQFILEHAFLHPDWGTLTVLLNRSPTIVEMAHQIERAGFSFVCEGGNDLAEVSLIVTDGQRDRAVETVSDPADMLETYDRFVARVHADLCAPK